MQRTRVISVITVMMVGLWLSITGPSLWQRMGNADDVADDRVKARQANRRVPLTTTADERRPTSHVEVLGQAASSTRKLYRWLGADGIVHLSSQPPTQSLNFEVVAQFELPPPVVAKESISVGHTETLDSANKAMGTTAANPTPAFVDNPLSVYTPEGFETLLQEAARVEQQLREREDTLESLVEQL